MALERRLAGAALIVFATFALSWRPAGRAGPAAAIGFWLLSRAVPVLDAERRGLSQRHADRHAGHRLRGRAAAGARRLAARGDDRSGRYRRAGATIRRPGRSACRSSRWRWSALRLALSRRLSARPHRRRLGSVLRRRPRRSAKRHRGDHHLLRLPRPGRSPTAVWAR